MDQFTQPNKSETRAAAAADSSQVKSRLTCALCAGSHKKKKKERMSEKNMASGVCKKQKAMGRETETEVAVTQQ